MSDELIAPGHLPTRVPDGAWPGVPVRGRRDDAPDVEVPPTRDVVVVAYRRGVTAVRRTPDGTWRHEPLRPGEVSLLTRAADSPWCWDRPVEVVPVALTHDRLTSTGREMYGREVEDVELHDTIKADDPAIHRITMTIAEEAAGGGVGTELLVDALTTQLSVIILRRYATVLFRAADAAGCLTLHQEHLVREYVRAHLDERLTLDELAASVGLSKFHFARRFRAATGTTPHEFVLRRRLDRARLLVQRTSTPLPEVAQACGFADQSHRNRIVTKRLGATSGSGPWPRCSRPPRSRRRADQGDAGSGRRRPRRR